MLRQGDATEPSSMHVAGGSASLLRHGQLVSLAIRHFQHDAFGVEAEVVTQPVDQFVQRSDGRRAANPVCRIQQGHTRHNDARRAEQGQRQVEFTLFQIVALRGGPAWTIEDLS